MSRSLSSRGVRERWSHRGISYLHYYCYYICIITIIYIIIATIIIIITITIITTIITIITIIIITIIVEAYPGGDSLFSYGYTCSMFALNSILIVYVYVWY